jgi:hypothetical protein
MAVWRRRALEQFPQFRAELQQPDYSIYMLFFDLLPMVREAHDSGDNDSARRIYDFAEWCLNQATGDLSNAAGVAFYEHLFDSKRHWSEVVRWLSGQVVATCRPLWDRRISGADLSELINLIENRRR